VTGLSPSRVSTFAEAEPKIRDTLSRQRAEQMAAEKVKIAGDRVKAGEDMQKVAKDLGGEYKAPPEFGADSAVEGLGAANTLIEGFSKPVGSILGPLNIMGVQVVAKVLDKVEPNPAGLAAERDGIVTALKQKKANERRDLFQDSILAKLLKDGKVKKHEGTIKRLIASYRS
jgi:peptidyl-prolyl cis-trans isomerase D